MTRKTRKNKKLSRKQPTFYDTINRQWFNDTVLPPTETRITQTYFISKVINRELDSLINQVKSGPIYEISRSWAHAEKYRIPFGMSSIIQVMQTMVTTRDISERMGWMRRYGMNAPLAVYVQGDPRDHSKCRVFIEEGMPGIGIPEYWLEREYAPTRAAYARYCRELSRTMGYPNMSMGYEAEEEMAHQYPMGTDRYETYNRINMSTWKELTTKYTKIDWAALLVAYGFNEEDLNKIQYNVTSPAFVYRLQTRMERWSIQRWQGWFSLVATQWIAGCSPHGPLRSAWFDFTQKFMQGMVADDSPTELRAAIVRALLPQTLGRLWVEKFTPRNLQKNIRRMVVSIHEAAAASLKHTSWMSPKTRAAAIKKLRMMDVQLAWPASWDDTEHGCTLNDRNYVENLLTLGGNRTDINIHRLRKGCAKRDLEWDRPTYEVNAFYYPEQNRFVLPAAILRPPFYDTNRSMAWNYGSIGATIGHELCHAFDSDGRRYDEHGDLRNWWTHADAKEYKARASKIMKLFDETEYRNMAVNGKNTLVENIADLGGLRFALEGLKSYMGRALKRDEIREFFTAYAVSWRSKERRKKAEQLLEMDVHSPPMLRVNLIVPQFDEWYEAFDVGSDHPNFIPPEKRVQFFL
jgi:putative endopeptidase